MIETLQFFQYLFIAPAIVSFLIVFLFTIYLVSENEIENFLTTLQNNKILKISFPILIITFSYIFISAEIIYSISRSEIKNELKNKPIEFKINNSLVYNERIIKDFNNIKRNSDRRNFSDKEIYVEINDIKLSLKQNIKIDSLYLVYYNNYKTTSNNPIGIIISNSLKKY